MDTDKGRIAIRERCRQRVGWFRSRSELYRRSNCGAEQVASSFNRDGVAPPEGLLPAG